jgi:hypothetical protein
MYNSLIKTLNSNNKLNKNVHQAKQLGIVLKVLYLFGNLVQHSVHICLVALCLKHNMGIPQDFGMTTEGEQTLSLGGDTLE